MCKKMEERIDREKEKERIGKIYGKDCGGWGTGFWHNDF